MCTWSFVDPNELLEYTNSHFSQFCNDKLVSCVVCIIKLGLQHVYQSKYVVKCSSLETAGCAARSAAALVLRASRKARVLSSSRTPKVFRCAKNVPALALAIEQLSALRTPKVASAKNVSKTLVGGYCPPTRVDKANRALKCSF
jgi:hypothetical protein